MSPGYSGRMDHSAPPLTSTDAFQVSSKYPPNGGTSSLMVWYSPVIQTKYWWFRSSANLLKRNSPQIYGLFFLLFQIVGQIYCRTYTPEVEHGNLKMVPQEKEYVKLLGCRHVLVALIDVLGCMNFQTDSMDTGFTLFIAWLLRDALDSQMTFMLVSVWCSFGCRIYCRLH